MVKLSNPNGHTAVKPKEQLRLVHPWLIPLTTSETNQQEVPKMISKTHKTGDKGQLVRHEALVQVTELAEAHNLKRKEQCRTIPRKPQRAHLKAFVNY